MVPREAVINEQLSEGQSKRFYSDERRSIVVLALKTAMAAGICYWLATLVHLQDGYWGSISAIIVMQSNVGSTVAASRDRLIGTLIGAGIGAVFSLLGTSLWAYLLAVIVAMVICGLLGLKNSARLAGVTVTILMLVHRTGSNWLLPMHRVLEVLLGIVVALAISTLVLPSHAKRRLQDGLAQQFLLMGSLFQAVVKGFRGHSTENLARLRKQVESAVNSNRQLRESSRNEPSNARASLEALSMLVQFGIGLQEILHALELAIKDKTVGDESNGSNGSKPNEYAAHLEPELDTLVNDIHRGFEHVAGCIHKWDFHEPPANYSLEDDVAALERKMTEIRPTGFNYDQSVILRAYAVQLHLKDLARLLRTSRIECDRIVNPEAHA